MDYFCFLCVNLLLYISSFNSNAFVHARIFSHLKKLPLTPLASKILWEAFSVMAVHWTSVITALLQNLHFEFLSFSYLLCSFFFDRRIPSKCYYGNLVTVVFLFELSFLSDEVSSNSGVTMENTEFPLRLLVHCVFDIFSQVL